MESEFSFEPNSKPKKFQKFNEDIILLNEDDSFAKKEIHEEINENPIFTLTIELEMGKTEKIDIFQNSDSYNIANDFCIEHNLGISTFQYLKEKIEYLIDEYKHNKNLDVKKCMNDINKEFNEINNQYITEEKDENNENINQSNNNIIFNNNDNNSNKKNKLDYFSYFLNKNKNLSVQNKNFTSSKTNDSNNDTIKNKRNNNYKNSNRENIKNKENMVQKYKKEIQIRNDINQYLDLKEKSNASIDKKITNYFDNYKSAILPTTKETNTKNNNNKNLSPPKNHLKNKISLENPILEDESYINKLFSKKEITRTKSSYFPSYFSKNDSIGRKKTSENTNSSSKINLDSIITNRTSNSRKKLLSNINFSKDSPIILNNKTINNYGQYLFEKGQIAKKEKQKEINEIQRLGDLDQYKLCSFKPKTNIKRNRNVHSKYMDNNKLILNEEKYDFKPKINNNYKTDLNFEQRQTIYNNLYKKKNEEMKKYFIDTKYDENGHELFKPKLISRQLHTEKNVDIFTKNYSYYKRYINKKNQLINKFYNNEYLNNKNICTKKHTDKIMDELYNKIFKYLFNELDSDHDDSITSLTLNLNEIPKYIINILKPILKELKEDEQTLNCEEFILVMKRLFEDTSMTDKQKFINYYQNKIKSNSITKSSKRCKTPHHFNLNSYYKNYGSKINNNNQSESKISSSKLNGSNKEDEDQENNNDNFCIECRESHISDMPEKKNGFDAITRYTFNNYLKQIKY